MPLSLPTLRHTEDDLILIKPAGLSCELPTHRAASTPPESLIDHVRRELPAPLAQLPHRLDRIARGIVVVALTPQSIAWHNQMIRDRRWAKFYLAELPVEAAAAGLKGDHRTYIRREGRSARIVRSGGDPALLGILAVAPAPSRERAHALIRLDTGRYHQIRVMLAHLGYPLRGDTLYGSTEADSPYLEHILLRLPLSPDESVHTFHLAEDPDRPTLAPEIARALQQLK